jgi:ATP-dependent DNA helicase PIF1
VQAPEVKRTQVVQTSGGNVRSDKGLSEEQLQAVQAALDGCSIFVTGSAGTGKSRLLKLLIRQLNDKYSEAAVAVTASTGIAALNIRGRTVHSFAGIGLARGSTAEIIKSVVAKKKVAARWYRVQKVL